MSEEQGRAPHNVHKLAEAAAIAATQVKPNSKNRCLDNLEIHPPHTYHREGDPAWKTRDCPGLKHRSKLRGMPRAERLARGPGSGS